MPKFIDTNEVVADLGSAITAALKNHGIEPAEIKIKVDPTEIRILVDLDGEDEV